MKIVRKVKLQDLVEISLTPATEIKEDGSLCILKASAVDDGKIIEAKLVKGELRSGKIAEKHYLKRGDIAFQAKGSTFEAIEIDKDYENLVTSQIYFNLRIKSTELITSGYLCWYLNSRMVQDYFSANTSGSTIKAVTKKTIMDLEISLPLNEKEMVEITNLIKSFMDEKNKTKTYLKDKELLIDETIINRIIK